MDSIGSISSPLNDPSNAVVNAVSSTALPTQLRSSEAQAAQTVADAQAAAQEDTVQLSAQARAQQLYELGRSDGDIARTLNTTTQTVDGYLGLTLRKELEHTLHPPLEA